MKLQMKKILRKLRSFYDRVAFKLSGRNKYILELRSRIKIVPTQKKADLIEVEIRRKQNEPDLMREEALQLIVAYEALQLRRDDI